MDFIKKLQGVITLIILSVVLLHAQQSSGVYDYPIKPGTSEWKALKTHQQMANICQIPEAILHSMSTKDLIETCLSYPLYSDMFFYDAIQVGFQAVTDHFNGLQELLKRNDAGTILLEKYKRMDPAFDHNWSRAKRSKFILNFRSIEILLAQEVVLSKLQATQKRSLIEECIRKSNEKANTLKAYGIFDQSGIALIAGRIMKIEKYIPLIQNMEGDERSKNFLQSGSMADSTLVKELLNHASQYLIKKD